MFKLADVGGGGTATPTPQVPAEDASSNGMSNEDLNALIDQELGLPTAAPAVTPTNEDAGDGDDNGADATDDAGEESTTGDEPTDGEPTGEEDAEEPEPEAEEEIDEDDPLNTPAPTTPSDDELFIEVEDIDGVTHKISSLDDLPEDFTPKNNVETIRILAELAKLDEKIAAREADREAAQVKADEAATQQEQFAAWDTELENLAKEGRIDLSDTDRINEVFGYMNKINAARQKAGNPNLISSVEDAYDKFVAQEDKAKAASESKADNDRAKQKASLIGRSSATAGNTPVYRAGQYRSIDDIPVNL